MKMLNKKINRNSKGTILPMAALLMTAIISLTAAGVDISYYGMLRSNLEKATEAAAVAGAQEYFRNGADAGMAINETVRVFKMNVSDDTMIGNYHNATGMGQPATLSYSRNFTLADNVRNMYRERPISLTVMTDISRGKITVSSELQPKPFFPLAPVPTIRITKEAELPPYDVVFVSDLSGSMRYETVNTYIGNAYVQVQGMIGLGPNLTDVILTQSKSQPGSGSMITANGMVTTVISVTDVVINTPGFDIPRGATYSTGTRIYNDDPERGSIVNTNMAGGRRLILTGYTVPQLMNLQISNEDRTLAQTVGDNRSTNAGTIATYFNRAAAYIEPHAGAVYGVMTFIDTVRIYGTAALAIGLVTFESSSTTSEQPSNQTASELRGLISGVGTPKRLSRTRPYLVLGGPATFDTVVNRLTVMALGGNGTVALPIVTYSYPSGATNIIAGLNNARATLNQSTRPSSTKIIILFTDGEPTVGTWQDLGNTVRTQTDAGIRVYSVVLTLDLTQTQIDNFRNAMENVGRAEPVIFINNPARLRDAYTQIADDLGLKLTN